MFLKSATLKIRLGQISLQSFLGRLSRKDFSKEFVGARIFVLSGIIFFACEEAPETVTPKANSTSETAIQNDSVEEVLKQPQNLSIEGEEGWVDVSEYNLNSQKLKVLQEEVNAQLRLNEIQGKSFSLAQTQKIYFEWEKRKTALNKNENSKTIELKESYLKAFEKLVDTYRTQEEMIAQVEFEKKRLQETILEKTFLESNRNNLLRKIKLGQEDFKNNLSTIPMNMVLIGKIPLKRNTKFETALNKVASEMFEVVKKTSPSKVNFYTQIDTISFLEKGFNTVENIQITDSFHFIRKNPKNRHLFLITRYEFFPFFTKSKSEIKSKTKLNPVTFSSEIFSLIKNSEQVELSSVFTEKEKILTFEEIDLTEGVELNFFKHQSKISQTLNALISTESRSFYNNYSKFLKERELELENLDSLIEEVGNEILNLKEKIREATVEYTEFDEVLAKFQREFLASQKKYEKAYTSQKFYVGQAQMSLETANRNNSPKDSNLREVFGRMASKSYGEVKSLQDSRKKINVTVVSDREKNIRKSFRESEKVELIYQEDFFATPNISKFKILYLAETPGKPTYLLGIAYQLKLESPKTQLDILNNREVAIFYPKTEERVIWKYYGEGITSEEKLSDGYWDLPTLGELLKFVENVSVSSKLFSSNGLGWKTTYPFLTEEVNFRGGQTVYTCYDITGNEVLKKGIKEQVGILRKKNTR